MAEKRQLTRAVAECSGNMTSGAGQLAGLEAGKALEAAKQAIALCGAKQGERGEERVGVVCCCLLVKQAVGAVRGQARWGLVAVLCFTKRMNGKQQDCSRPSRSAGPSKVEGGRGRVLLS